MNNPKYTFLLPAYKAKFFAEALESIINQTYKDFLCIVSDDCSPEDLKSIYKEVVGDDSRFTFRRNAKNMGSISLVSHWNILVDMCDTDFFIMASDDDVYEPNFLEEIDNLTNKYPEVDMFRGKMRYINSEGELLRKDPLIGEYLDRLHFLECYYSGHILSCEACFCYRTNKVRENGKYMDFPLAIFTDDAEHIVMSKNGCVNTANYVFNYRQSNLAITYSKDNSASAKKKIIAAFMFCDWFINYYKDVEMSDERWLRGIVENLIKSRIKDNIYYISTKLNKKDFFWLCKNINGRLQIPRIVLFYNWSKPKFYKCLSFFKKNTK